jgi:hypothetical protein
MKTLGGVLFVCLLAAGCSKKADRQAMCDTAKSAFVEGMKTQIDQFDNAGNKSAAGMLRKMVTTAEPRFMKFCTNLSDADVDCISRGAAAVTDPECKHAVDTMKTELLGM